MSLTQTVKITVFLAIQAIGCFFIYQDTNQFGRRWLLLDRNWLWLGKLRAAIAVLIFSLSAVSTIKFVMTHPGKVPFDWDKFVQNKNFPMSHSDPHSFHPRSAVFCQFCNRARPERSYHCEQEGICIMKYDSWSRRYSHSIGLRNGKLWLLSSLYSTYMYLWTAWACGQQAIGLNWDSLKAMILMNSDNDQDRDGSIRILIAFMFLFLYIPLGIASLASLIRFSIRCASNRTLKEANFTIRNPYDLGVWKNLEQVLGPFSYHWLTPSRVEYPDNAGLFYPVNIPVFDGKYGSMLTMGIINDDN